VPLEILRAAKIVDSMRRAHATQKGAVGLELGDEKGKKEMIDAPMLKQVTTSGYTYPFIYRNTRGLGREDYPNGARCRPTNSNSAMNASTMRLSSRNHLTHIGAKQAMGGSKSL
jgi:hypothetical protein